MASRALLAAALPVIDPSDRLSRLPEEVLARILSLLPAQEAVRTCVLARAWHHVWKFTRRLRITGRTVDEARKFVDGLLALRLDGLKRASVDECEIMIMIDMPEDHDTVINHWIECSLKCQVQALRVLILSEIQGPFRFLVMDSPLVSRHLTRLELHGVCFGSDLNLDGCPALEHLEIRSCWLLGLRKIMSQSLERLVITKCDFYDDEDSPRFKISAPCLVSLWLEVGNFRAPFLESMPELVEAHVRIDNSWYDYCYCDDPMGCHHARQAGHISDSDVDSDYEEDHPEGCVLLEGLAQAKDLALLAEHSKYIFRRDLRLCPTFSNLKTLVLNDYWCKPSDCRALACILEHAPVLENLTIVFSEKVELEYDIVLEGRPDATAESTMTTQCLETVKVKCHTVDAGVKNVLKFLSTLNIRQYMFQLGVTQGST